MPCHPARARKLMHKRRATGHFDRDIFFIRLLDREDGETQEIAAGIDPGSKKEAITLKSESHTYLNTQMDAVTGVKRKMKTRRMMRKARRRRKTPYRKMRTNRKQLRNKDRIPPSTKARWDWKLRLCKYFAKYYPIKTYVVEDISAKTRKGQRKWNVSFSPLEVGKNWFYSELRKMGHVELVKGYETKKERDRLGLKKSKNKLSDSWHAHCVDSWCLANMWIGGHTEPDNKNILHLAPLKFRRRQLHMLQPTKGCIRKPDGGTMSKGFKRGSRIRHHQYGICYVGGSSKGRISLHNLEDGKRLTQYARPEDCTFLAYCSWRSKRTKG